MLGLGKVVKLGFNLKIKLKLLDTGNLMQCNQDYNLMMLKIEWLENKYVCVL